MLWEIYAFGRMPYPRIVSSPEIIPSPIMILRQRPSGQKAANDDEGIIDTFSLCPNMKIKRRAPKYPWRPLNPLTARGDYAQNKNF